MKAFAELWPAIGMAAALHQNLPLKWVAACFGFYQYLETT